MKIAPCSIGIIWSFIFAYPVSFGCRPPTRSVVVFTHPAGLTKNAVTPLAGEALYAATAACGPARQAAMVEELLVVPPNGKTPRAMMTPPACMLPAMLVSMLV